jgi:hypothetical protein
MDDIDGRGLCAELVTERVSACQAGAGPRSQPGEIVDQRSALEHIAMADRSPPGSARGGLLCRLKEGPRPRAVMKGGPT